MVLAILLGALILLKSRQWKDAALIWLLFGLSIGPLIVLSWNLAYRRWLSGWLSPCDRLALGPLAGIQFRYLYLMTNTVLNLGCVLALAMGISKLYSKAKQRPRLVPPRKATTDDPRI